MHRPSGQAFAVRRRNGTTPSACLLRRRLLLLVLALAASALRLSSGLRRPRLRAGGWAGCRGTGGALRSGGLATACLLLRPRLPRLLRGLLLLLLLRPGAVAAVAARLPFAVAAAGRAVAAVAARLPFAAAAAACRCCCCCCAASCCCCCCGLPLLLLLLRGLLLLLLRDLPLLLLLGLPLLLLLLRGLAVAAVAAAPTVPERRPAGQPAPVRPLAHAVGPAGVAPAGRAVRQPCRLARPSPQVPPPQADVPRLAGGPAAWA